MCKKHVTAHIDATFETQQSFSLFCKNVGTCQLALGTRAQVIIESDAGLAYRLRLMAD